MFFGKKVYLLDTPSANKMTERSQICEIWQKGVSATYVLLRAAKVKDQFMAKGCICNIRLSPQIVDAKV